MTPKQSYPTLAGMGQGKEQSVSCEQNSILPVPTRQEICADCHYLRTVRLSARCRTFCVFTGEKIRPSTPACEFWPGIPYAEAVIS